MNPLPQAFVWTRIGTEAGQPLESILRRKDLERQAGNGCFAWGVGSALGSAVAELMGKNSNAEVIFSPMASKPKLIDVDPGEIALWTAYVDGFGCAVPLPKHLCITSRYHAGKRAYALFCRSETPLLPIKSDGQLAVGSVVNLGSGSPIGASQVTAVVRHDPENSGGRQYSVALRATLNGVGFARLCNPIPLSIESKRKIDMTAEQGLSAWENLLHEMHGQSGRLE